MASYFSKFDSDRIVAAIAAAERRPRPRSACHVTRRVPEDLEDRAACAASTGSA